MRRSSWRLWRNRWPRRARASRARPAPRGLPICRRCWRAPRSMRCISRRRPSCIRNMPRWRSPRSKHVLTEKPMAITIDQGQAMIEAAERAGVVLLVGHSHCYDLPIKTMREIVASGSLGRVRMIHTWNFTDWIYRPRRPDELDISLGGGVTFRQGSHQFDIIRLLGGGLVKTVHATTFDWDVARRSIGAHTVFMQFADGAAATAVYNGYGYFSTMELIEDVTEWGFTEPLEKRAPVRRSAGSAADELAAKRKRAGGAIPASAPHQPHFGLTLVSCERGDIRQSPDGLFVYSDKGREEIKLANDRSPRDLVLDEFAAAISGQGRAIHDGRWGLANLEICLAAIESSKSGKAIELKHHSSDHDRGAAKRVNPVIQSFGRRARIPGPALQRGHDGGAEWRYPHASHQAGRIAGHHAAFAWRRQRGYRAHRRGCGPADQASRRMPRADVAGASGRSAGRSVAGAPERQSAVAHQGCARPRGDPVRHASSRPRLDSDVAVAGAGGGSGNQHRVRAGRRFRRRADECRWIRPISLRPLAPDRPR